MINVSHNTLFYIKFGNHSSLFKRNIYLNEPINLFPPFYSSPLSAVDYTEEQPNPMSKTCWINKDAEPEVFSFMTTPLFFMLSQTWPGVQPQALHGSHSVSVLGQQAHGRTQSLLRLVPCGASEEACWALFRGGMLVHAGQRQRQLLRWRSRGLHLYRPLWVILGLLRPDKQLKRQVRSWAGH